jgi:hypothetical protein
VSITIGSGSLTKDGHQNHKQAKRHNPNPLTVYEHTVEQTIQNQKQQLTNI